MRAWVNFPDIQRERQRTMALSKLDRIRELHSPIVPPNGMRLMGSIEGEKFCAGCDCGDPYLAIEWPCETREICDEDIED